MNPQAGQSIPAREAGIPPGRTRLSQPCLFTIMDLIILEAKPREAGKKASKAARYAGEVPCILYGHNVEPVLFQVPVLSLNPLIHTDEAHRVEVQVDEQKWTCILRDITYDAVTDVPIHVDFQVLRAGEKIHLSVPIQYHGKPIGQERGGEVDYVLHTVEVTCLPKDIPAHIDVEIGHLDIGDALHIGDVSIPGITFLVPSNQTLVTVVGARRLDEVASLAEAAGAGPVEGLEDEA